MKLAETCVKYPVFTVMLIAFLVTLGAFSYRGLAVDLFPKADPATVNVEVQLPGATPEEVVTGVVLPLEDAISSVSGIDEIAVWSFEGFAYITCTFVLERDIEGAAQDIREKVAGAISRLPRDTLPPIITKQDPQSDPIMTILVSGPMSRRELTEIADKQVRRAVQTVDGVGSVELNGGQERQIRVLLDAQKLTAHNFTVLDVREALRRENIEAPGGRMITGPQELGLRTLGRVTSAEQFGEIVLGTRGGTPVRIRDVARVEDGAQELRTVSARFRKGTAAQEVVAIQVLRQSGANTVRVADDVRSKLDDLRAQMPPGIQLQVVHDISDFIKASVHSLIEHLILGSVLASMVVWLFIRNWRAVLIAAVAIPASIIATFTLMRGMDFSLNNLTLLALTLAVGIVIDDAIIVLENIFRFVPVAPARDYSDLCGDFSFHIRFLSSGGTRLDSRRRPIRIDQFLLASRRHLSRQNHQARAGDGRAHHCPAGGGPGPIVYARDDQSRPLFHRAGAAQRAKPHARADGHRRSWNPFELPKHDLQRTPAFRSGR